MSTISDKSRMNIESGGPRLFIYRSREQIETYRLLSVEERLQRLEMMSELYYYTMPEKAKRLRERYKEK